MDFLSGKILSKYSLKALTTLSLVAALFVIGSSAGALRILTEKQIEDIASSCQSAQVELNSLHNGDALMRANLGQQYESILNDLIVPFNSRLANNDIDNSQLIKLSGDYRKALDSLREAYSQYERVTRSTMEMNCKEQPVEFYESVEEVRKSRSKLHKRVGTLNYYLKLYYKDFKAIKSDWEAKNG